MIDSCYCYYGDTQTPPIQCKSCVNTEPCQGEKNGELFGCQVVDPNLKKITQQKIWNQTGVYTSEYILNKSSLTVINGRKNKPLRKFNFVNWNQSSDRNIPSLQKKIVATRGNSLKQTLTSLRPGGSSPGGYGVDIKHGSYDRYLNRKKGKNLRGSPNIDIKPKFGNKTRTYSLISGCECK